MQGRLRMCEVDSNGHYQTSCMLYCCCSQQHNNNCLQMLHSWLVLKLQWYQNAGAAGSGANTALLDAWDLAQQLVNGGHSSIQAAITQFAAEAAPRSAQAVGNGHRMIAAFHSGGLVKQLLVLALRIMGFLTSLGSTVPYWIWRSGGSMSSLWRQAVPGTAQKQA